MTYGEKNTGFTPRGESPSAFAPTAPTGQPDMMANLKAELHGDERLIWSGQPIPGRVRNAGFAIWFFAIPWTAFSLFWESMALLPLLSLFFGIGKDAVQKGNVPLAMAIVFPLFGLPFIGIGFWLLLKPFGLYKQAKLTIYGLTDRRALILQGGSRSNVESFSLGAMGKEMVKSENKDGTGSIYFAFKRTADSDGDLRTEKKGFEQIQNVREAYDKITRAIESYAPAQEEKLGAP